MRDRENKQVEDSIAEDDEPTLGDILKSARNKGEVSLREIAEEMRVEQSVLDSLEANEFERLGPAVFVKGYIKQYGRHLGLEYNDLLAAYYRQVGAQEIVILPTRSIQLRDERQITAWIVAGLILLVLAVMLFVWWLGGGEGLIPRSPVAASAPAATRAGAAGAVESVSRVSTGASVAAPSRAVTRNSDPRSGSDAADVANAAPTVQPLEALSAPAPENGADEPTESPAEAAVEDPVESDAVQLDENLVAVAIAFDEESWAEISDANGARLFYDLGRAGTETVVHGAPPISVFFGNADGVRLTVDGVDFSIPARSRRGNLANFRINPPAD